MVFLGFLYLTNSSIYYNCNKIIIILIEWTPRHRRDDKIQTHDTQNTRFETLSDKFRQAYAADPNIEIVCGKRKKNTL